MRRTHKLVIAAIGAVLALTSCTSTETTTPPRTPTPSPTAAPGGTPAPVKPALIDPAAVDATAPEKVAEAVAIASVTWDTTLHSSEYAAIGAVLALLTPELAAMYAPVSQDGNPATDATWAQARDVGAYNVPDVRTAQANHSRPADTATTLYRVYDATWTWHGPGGITINDPRTRYLYLTISQQPDGRWLVSTFDTADV